MLNAYQAVDTTGPDTSQPLGELRSIAEREGHIPYAVLHYWHPDATAPVAVELMSWPVVRGNTVRIFARLTPNDPTSARWLDANRITSTHDNGE